MGGEKKNVKCIGVKEKKKSDINLCTVEVFFKILLKVNCTESTIVKIA